MKRIAKNKSQSALDNILNKVKNLKNDIVYPITAITKNSDSNRVYVSRLADRGEIVKVKRGFFYKPTNKTLYKNSNLTIPLNKSIFTNDLFWSVKDGYEINAGDLIKAYLLDYTEDDLMALYSLFGYKRVLRDSLKIYKKRTNPDYKKIRDILERFEYWRLNDK